MRPCPPARALVTSLFLLAVAAGWAHAQKKAGLPSPVPAPLFKKLDLSPDQESRLAAAHRGLEAEMRRIKAETPGDEIKAAVTAASAAYRRTLEQTLTPEQQVRLLDLYVAAQEYRALGEIGYYLAVLDLSESQRRAVLDRIAEAQPELERLGAAAKQNRDETAAEAAIVRGRLIEEVTSILTPDQRRMLPARKK